ncbi:MAG: hypothetical protein QXT64_08310 [Desulfurococcaceae archaeon]
MTCTKAQILILLEKIKEELINEDDKKLLDEYIERIRRTAWLELISQL